MSLSTASSDRRYDVCELYRGRVYLRLGVTPRAFVHPAASVERDPERADDVVNHLLHLAATRHTTAAAMINALRWKSRDCRRWRRKINLSANAIVVAGLCMGGVNTGQVVGDIISSLLGADFAKFGIFSTHIDTVSY